MPIPSISHNYISHNRRRNCVGAWVGVAGGGGEKRDSATLRDCFQKKTKVRVNIAPSHSVAVFSNSQERGRPRFERDKREW